MRFNGPGCACALFGSGFGSAYSALLGRTHGAGRWRFQWPGLRVYPFARRLVRLTLRFWVKRMGRAGCGFVGRGVHAPLLARSLACSALWGRARWTGRWRFCRAGVAGIGKGYFSSSAAGEQNSPPQGFPEHAFFSITTGLPPGFTQACFSLAFSRLFVKNKHRPRSQNANIFVFPDGSLPFRQAS